MSNFKDIITTIGGMQGQSLFAQRIKVDVRTVRYWSVKGIPPERRDSVRLHLLAWAEEKQTAIEALAEKIRSI